MQRLKPYQFLYGFCVYAYYYYYSLRALRLFCCAMPKKRNRLPGMALLGSAMPKPRQGKEEEARAMPEHRTEANRRASVRFFFYVTVIL